MNCDRYNPNRCLFFAFADEMNQIDPETKEGAIANTEAVIIGCDCAQGERNMTARIKAQ
jgi:hypothetical protein